MDWRILHAIYDVSLHHHWVGTLFYDIEKASIPVMVIVTAGLWLFARPGGGRRWKLAATSALGSAALALLLNLVIHSLYDRPRPYESHAISHPWSSSTDASFPSDHASASLAIAFTVLFFSPAVGVAFVVLAMVIAVGRLFIGAHYPGDVLAAVVVAAVAAVVVVRFARPAILALVRLVERVTDPILRPVWRAGSSRSGR